MQKLPTPKREKGFLGLLRSFDSGLPGIVAAPERCRFARIVRAGTDAHVPHDQYTEGRVAPAACRFTQDDRRPARSRSDLPSSDRCRAVAEGYALELPPAASLTDLWCDQGKRTEARDLLAPPIYAWFAECRPMRRWSFLPLGLVCASVHDGKSRDGPAGGFNVDLSGRTWKKTT